MLRLTAILGTRRDARKMASGITTSPVQVVRRWRALRRRNMAVSLLVRHVR